MKTLSIRQPWAWLIVNGYKDIENRKYKRSFRGKLLIHAGKIIDKDGYDRVKRTFPEIPLPAPKDLECGGIVGTATMADCVPFEEVSENPWAQGPWCWGMKDARPLPFMGCRGSLSFFEVEYEAIKAIETVVDEEIERVFGENLSKFLDRELNKERYCHASCCQGETRLKTIGDSVYHNAVFMVDKYCEGEADLWMDTRFCLCVDTTKFLMRYKKDYIHRNLHNYTEKYWRSVFSSDEISGSPRYETDSDYPDTLIDIILMVLNDIE